MPGANTLPDPEQVDDAYLHGDMVILKLRNGGTLALPYHVASSIYWEVKIRNRRRAFGL